MKKKIALIIGWHHKKNIGDEANLYCLSKILKSNFDIKKIYVLNHSSDIDFKLNYLKSILTKNRYINYLIKFFLLKFYIKSSDIIIFGAGGIFKSKWGIDKKNSYLKFANQKSYKIALGVSLEVNKYKKIPVLKRKVLELFNKFNLSVVRDKKSFIFLNNNNVKNVYLQKDIAHLLPNFIRNKKKNNLKKTISISFCKWEDKPNNNNILLNKLTKLIHEITNKYNFEKINLIPFSYDASSLSDIKDLYALKKNLIKIEKQIEKKIFFYDKEQNFKKIYNLISESDLVIGVRLHSQIFSLINGVPLLAFPYCEKIVNYLQDKKNEKYYLLEQSANFNRKAIYKFLDKNLFLRKKVKKIDLNDFKKIFNNIKIQ